MKKYIKSYEEYDALIDKEIVNPEDAQYGDPLTVVEIGDGGYSSSKFYVYCDPRNAEAALEKTVAYCEKKGYTWLLYEEDEIDPEYEEDYIYIDATMEGASQPYYLPSWAVNIHEA